MMAFWRFLYNPQLDFYVLRRFAVLYAGNLVCIILVYVAIDSFEKLDDFAAQTSSSSELLMMLGRYYLACVPSVFCQLLGPVVSLVSGLFTVTLFLRSNELIPMLANGRPFWRIVLPILVAGFLVSVGTFLVQELWIPHTADMIKEMQGKKEGSQVLEDQTYHDYELGILIDINEYHVLDQEAKNVTVIHIPGHVKNKSGESEFFIFAESMKWVEPELEDQGYWELRTGRVQEYKPLAEDPGATRLVPPPYDGPRGLPRPLSKSFIVRRLKTSLIPEDIEAQKEDVVYMQLSELRHKMNNAVDRRWATKYYARFATPLGALVLLFIGLPLISTFASRNVFLGALLAALVACVFLISSSLFTVLSIRGVLPAPLGAWASPLLFTSLGVTWLRYLK